MVSCCSFKSAFVIVKGKFTLKKETKQSKTNSIMNQNKKAYLKQRILRLSVHVHSNVPWRKHLYCREIKESVKITLLRDEFLIFFDLLWEGLLTGFLSPFFEIRMCRRKLAFERNLISRNQSYYFITKGDFYQPLISLEELSERSPKVANRTRIFPRFPKTSEDSSVESLTRKVRKWDGFRSRARVLNQLGFWNKYSKNTFPVSFS